MRRHAMVVRGYGGGNSLDTFVAKAYYTLSNKRNPYLCKVVFDYGAETLAFERFREVHTGKPFEDLEHLTTFVKYLVVVKATLSGVVVQHITVERSEWK